MANKCKGFVCGSNIIEGSLPGNRIDYGDLVELIKEILIDQSGESWMKEVIENILKDSIDSDWLREFFKELLEKYAKEEWFKDIICSLGCLSEPDVFDVIPTDITFEATGGTATVSVIVGDDETWELVL